MISNVRYIHMKERFPTGIGRKCNEFLEHIKPHLKIREHILRHVEFNFMGRSRFGYLSLLANKLIPLIKSKDEIFHCGDFSLSPFISDSFEIMEIADMLPFEEFYNYQQNLSDSLNMATYVPHTLTSEVIVVPSQETKEKVKSFFGNKAIIKIPFGIDFEFFVNDNLEKKSNTILCVASYYPQKNLLKFIEACGIVSEEKSIELRLIGRHRGNLLDMDLIARNYPNLRFTFLGYLSQERLKEEYQMATIYCSPSLREGFGLTPIQAMACGTLPVISDISPHREIIGNSGLYFDPRNVYSISEALIDGLNYEYYSDELRFNSLQFSWENVIPKWLSLYSSLGVKINVS